jgi:hypothetical protein
LIRDEFEYQILLKQLNEEQIFDNFMYWKNMYINIPIGLFLTKGVGNNEN